MTFGNVCITFGDMACKRQNHNTSCHITSKTYACMIEMADQTVLSLLTMETGVKDMYI